jgi:hypothetical protein
MAKSDRLCLSRDELQEIPTLDPDTLQLMQRPLGSLTKTEEDRIHAEVENVVRRLREAGCDKWWGRYATES